MATETSPVEEKKEEVVPEPPTPQPEPKPKSGGWFSGWKKKIEKLGPTLFDDPEDENNNNNM